MSQSCSVLIVDDNTSFSQTMSFVLSRKGYETSTAEDGLEALEQVKQRQFDVILLDIKLPKLDGVEVYRRIKDSQPNVPVLMMTAYSVNDLVQEAIREGAYAVIRKPLDLDQLISMIEAARKPGQDARVLVVDDQPGTCVTFKNILSRRGCEVAVAHDGEAAVRLAGQESFDIIFLDMKLPTINGLETYRAIRRLLPDAVVVVMTGFREEMASDVAEALDACAYSCLYKPLDMETVLAMIERLSNRRERAS